MSSLAMVLSTGSSGGLRLALGLEVRAVLDVQLVEPELGHDLQGGQAVGDAAAEVDARGFVEVPDRDRDVTELEAEVDGLGEELGVEGDRKSVV